MTTIEQWLDELDLGKYIAVFAEAEVDMLALPLLTEDDLRDLGLPLGPRRKILVAAKSIDAGDSGQNVASESTTPLRSEQTKQTQSAMQTSASTPPAAERRHLTIMFVDLIDSTKISTKLDVEDMRELITLYQNTVSDVIGRFNGFVARFMGDGVMCYFGWPRASEDDAERGVRAGLAVIAAVMRINGPQNLPLATRVSVASGVVVVGDLIGSGASEEAAVVGNTPNLAARLQQLARPNQLVVAEATKDLLGNLFELESLGKHELKGISDPVQAFAVVGVSALESRFAARQSGVLAPMFGRSDELQRMQQRWEQVCGGQGQGILITGEAGIGKSRVLHAMIDEISADIHFHIIYQCSPYYTDSAFYPILSQLTLTAEIQPTDSVQTRLRKLEGLASVTSENLPVVATLLGIDMPGQKDLNELTPSEQRTRTLQALCQMYAEMAAEKPLLLAFEDLHWIDPTSLEMFGMLLQTIADKPVLLLATARDNFTHSFGVHQQIEHLRLDRLDTGQIRAIVEQLTDGRPVVDEVVQLIARRTDGVPLFVEELTKTLLESEQLLYRGQHYTFDGELDNLAIPNSLHDSLMARLDRMQPIKMVAQIAACIGREFDYQLLLEVSPLPQTSLDSALENLIEAELVYSVQQEHRSTYLFKHALLRDAAYNSLLKERRRSIHARILEILKTASQTEPELLAYHAAGADNSESAAGYWEQAGDLAVARPAFLEAISYFDKSLQFVTSLPELEDRTCRELELRAKISYASMAFYGFGHSVAAAANSAARDLLEKVDQSSHRAPVLYGSWTIHNARAEYARALEVAEVLIQDAKQGTDRVPQLNAHRMRGVTLTMLGDFALTDGDFQKAHALYDPSLDSKLALQYGLDPSISIRVYWATSLLCRGEAQRASDLMHNIAEQARASGHLPTYSAALYQLALQNQIRGTPECEYWIGRSMQVSEEHGLVFWKALANAVSGAHMNAQKRHTESVRQMAAALKFLDSMGVISNVALYNATHASSLAALGKYADSADAERMAITLIESNDKDWTAPEIYRVLAVSHYWHQNDSEKAIDRLRRSIAIAQKQKARLWSLRAALSMARILVDKGEVSAAMAQLKVSLSDLPDGGRQLPDAQEAEKLLTQLSARLADD